MNTQNSTTLNPPVYLGVDVAKRELVLDLLNTIHRFENSSSGIRKLLAVIARHPACPAALIVCEPSGGYEAQLVFACLDAARPVCMAQPLRVRRFAQSLGLSAKTDPIDARLLSRFGAERKPAVVVSIDEDRRHLVALLNRRDELLHTFACENNRAEHHTDALCRRQHRQLLKLLEKQITDINVAVEKLIASKSSLQSARTLLCQVQGVGPQTSATLLAQLPELGRIGREQISALAGLAPYNRDSGASCKKRFIQGGRSKIRRALYMAAITAARCNPALKPFYLRLRANGKAVKVALIAVARKLLIHLNSLLADFYKCPVAS